jgi:hypothetical protein
MYTSQEDRIRQLCSQILSAPDDEALNRIIPELQAAMHEHCENLRMTLVKRVPIQKEDVAMSNWQNG